METGRCSEFLASNEYPPQRSQVDQIDQPYVECISRMPAETWLQIFMKQKFTTFGYITLCL
jgi:hypothetical protein